MLVASPFPDKPISNQLQNGVLCRMSKTGLISAAQDEPFYATVKLASGSVLEPEETTSLRRSRTR